MDVPDVHKHLRCIRQTWGVVTKEPGPIRETLLGRPLTACAVAAGLACRAVALTQAGGLVVLSKAGTRLAPRAQFTASPPKVRTRDGFVRRRNGFGVANLGHRPRIHGTQSISAE